MNQQDHGPYSPFNANEFFTGCITSFDLANLRRPTPLLKLLIFDLHLKVSHEYLA